MIRAQRRVHQSVWLGLLVVVPILLAAALAARTHRRTALEPQASGAAP